MLSKGWANANLPPAYICYHTYHCAFRHNRFHKRNNTNRNLIKGLSHHIFIFFIHRLHNMCLVQLHLLLGISCTLMAIWHLLYQFPEQQTHITYNAYNTFSVCHFGHLLLWSYVNAVTTESHKKVTITTIDKVVTVTNILAYLTEWQMHTQYLLQADNKIGRDCPDVFRSYEWIQVLNDLESYNLTLTEAVNMAQNHPLWRLAASGAMHS